MPWLAPLTFLKGMGGFFFGTLMGRVMGLILVASVGLMVYTHHIKATTKAEVQGTVVTQVTGAVESSATLEQARRLEAILDAQIAAKKALDELQLQAQAAARHLKEIDDASRAHDNEPCFGPDSVRRLNEIGTLPR